MVSVLDFVLRERDFNKDLRPDMDGSMCSDDNFAMYWPAPYVATQWLAAIATAVAAAQKLGNTEVEIPFAEVLKEGRRPWRKRRGMYGSA